MAEDKMDGLAVRRFMRLKEILGDRNADPPKPALIPVARSTWWAGVKSGRFPQSVKLGPRTTAWRSEDIYSFIENPVDFREK